MVNLGWLGLELLLAAAGAEVEAPALLLLHMAGSGPINLPVADRVAHHVPGAGLFRIGALAVARMAGRVTRKGVVSGQHVPDHVGRGGGRHLKKHKHTTNT